ncbi:DUF4339 domain-containing protein [Maribacter antarcticus]|uniref:DUF4339 domain-containing protein n=1 Tax=Maribacter antarcticus TaxID=505250 RepID=UPI002934FCE7|nr:DUF4339 domain-containing protein [Maribacter antarcticus]
MQHASPPPVPLQVSCFYAVNGQQSGTVSFDKLKEFFTNRTIKRDSLVWKKGMTNWTTLK